MGLSGYPSFMAVGTGCACALAARLLADCTWGETAWRAVVGLLAGWLLARLVAALLQQARRGGPAPVDLAENPLTDAMVAGAKQEAMEPQVAAQDAAQIVSRMMKQPADKE